MSRESNEGSGGDNSGAMEVAVEVAVVVGVAAVAVRCYYYAYMRGAVVVEECAQYTPTEASGVDIVGGGSRRVSGEEYGHAACRA